jgi:hypothetical protein
MNPTKLKGRVIVEGHCKGEALVSAQPISFLGGVDPADGKIIERKHDLSGICMLYSLAKNRLAPKAIINQTADPVVVVGAIIANVPMIDQVDISKIKTGDVVDVDASKGTATVLRHKES